MYLGDAILLLMKVSLPTSNDGAIMENEEKTQDGARVFLHTWRE